MHVRSAICDAVRTPMLCCLILSVESSSQLFCSSRISISRYLCLTLARSQSFHSPGLCCHAYRLPSQCTVMVGTIQPAWCDGVSKTSNIKSDLLVGITDAVVKRRHQYCFSWQRFCSGLLCSPSTRRCVGYPPAVFKRSPFDTRSFRKALARESSPGRDFCAS